VSFESASLQLIAYMKHQQTVTNYQNKQLTVIYLCNNTFSLASFEK